MDVILEYPATPNETRGIRLAFAKAGINARLRAAPRRRESESAVWRLVVNAPLHELLVATGAPRFAVARAVQRLVADIGAAWGHRDGGHVEVGPRGVGRRATGGVLLTPELPGEAYARLVLLAASTLDPERLLLWDPDIADWSTFDSGVPEPVGSAAQGAADLGGERVQRRFRRVG
jgi:hypothetical protein